MATVRVPVSEEVSLQQAVVAVFPNVTALNIGDVLDGFTRVLIGSGWRFERSHYFAYWRAPL